MRQHENLQLAAIGHGLAVVVGLGAIIAGVLAIVNSLPGVLGATLLVLGCMLPAVAHFSWRLSRAAWSVMISTLCVFAAVTLFGSPKIAAVMHVDLGIALLIPIVQVAAVIVLAQIRADYREQ